MTRRQQPERELQKQCVKYLRLLPVPPNGPWWTAVSPNAGKRSFGAAKLAQAMGLQPGVPDLLIVWHGHFWGIELKAPKGSVSESQRATRAAITAAGGTYVVVRSIEELQSVLNQARDQRVAA